MKGEKVKARSAKCVKVYQHRLYRGSGGPGSLRGGPHCVPALLCLSSLPPPPTQPHTHKHNHSQNITKCVIRWLQISERTNAGNDFKFPLNCPGFDPVSFFFFFHIKNQGQVFFKKKKRKQAAEARHSFFLFLFFSFFFFFCFSKKFILLPSKQAEWAQTADNKIRSGNNYHPLRLDSHICMMLEST